MIRALFIGVWSCIVAIGAAYVGILWFHNDRSVIEPTTNVDRFTHVGGRQISVPIASNGQVKGYVVAKIGYLARAGDLTKLDIKPDVFLFDAAFSAVFNGDGLNIGVIDQTTLKDFSRRVKEKMNRRLGAEVIHEVITEELAYLPFEQIRGRLGSFTASRMLPRPTN